MCEVVTTHRCARQHACQRPARVYLKHWITLPLFELCLHNMLSFIPSSGSPGSIRSRLRVLSHLTFGTTRVWLQLVVISFDGALALRLVGIHPKSRDSPAHTQSNHRGDPTLQIFDSRGNPTIEVDVITELGVFRAAVPSGASTGSCCRYAARVLWLVACVGPYLVSAARGVGMRFQHFHGAA